MTHANRGHPLCGHLDMSPTSSSNIATEQPSFESEGRTLDRVLGLFEKTLLINSQAARSGPRKQKPRRPLECKVCDPLTTILKTTVGCGL